MRYSAMPMKITFMNPVAEKMSGWTRREMLPLVSSHRTRIFEAIMAGKPEEAREASHRHLAFIEEILLDRSREESRRERSLRRLEQRKN